MNSRTAAAGALTHREFNRRSAGVTVVVRVRDGKTASGTSTDVSLGGMRISTADVLAPGDIGTAKISSPQGRLLSADVEVVWRKANDVGPDSVGLRFQSLTEPQRFTLLEYIYAGGHDGEQPEDEAASPESEGKHGSTHLTPSVYDYYVRLLRRIEQVHALSPSVTDQLLYSRMCDDRSLHDALLLAKVVGDDGFAAFMSAIYDVPFIDLRHHRADPSVADTIPTSLATAQNVIPLERVDGHLVIAMADPLDLPLIDLVQMRNHEPIQVRFALVEEIQNALHDVYQEARLQTAETIDMSPGASGLDQESAVEDLETLRRMSDATPIISLVDSLLRSAVEDEASDIHLEPWADKTIVRFRLDGVLHAIRTLPKQIYLAVVSRIKIMSHMDITIRHVPQDGRASMRYARKDFDLRISTVPTHHGEKIVIRLLEKNPTFTTLSAVGLNDSNYKLMAPQIRRPHGMILCCGPTGSGKSTTLFAILQEINDGTTNITTIEDPIEYSVEGVNQIEVNAKRGLTFSSVLRALLRQDPDVVYVGEIRDRETAELAVRAALTGHLLLSTLHTNTAVQAIARLVDIGVDPALIGASIIAVVGQRLLRRICEKCKVSYEVPADEALVLEELLPLNAPHTLFRGTGCGACHETGYRGRMPVHEVVVVDEGLRRLISKGVDSTQLLDYVSTKLAYTDLRSDALARMLDGKTTLQEVVRMTV